MQRCVIGSMHFTEVNNSRIFETKRSCRYIGYLKLVSKLGFSNVVNVPASAVEFELDAERFTFDPSYATLKDSTMSA